MIGLAIVTAFLWLLWGPGSPFASRRDEAARAPAVVGEVPAPRLASTSPAITDTLVDLGLIEHLVGRSAYCTSVPRGMPVVGDLRAFDAERLVVVDPAVLFVQTPLAGVDPALASFCESRGIALVAQRIDSLADLAALVEAIGREVPANGLDRARAERLTPRIAAALAEIVGTRAADGAPSDAEIPLGAGGTRVLLLAGADPFLAVGRGGYLDELLARAGFVNAFEGAGYAELSAEAVVALAPSTVLGLAGSADGAARMREAIERLPWSQGALPRIATGAEPDLLAPSLRAVRAAPRLAELAANATAPAPAPIAEPAP
jgi:ABC-type hemin transport system substrate-binding protein